MNKLKNIYCLFSRVMKEIVVKRIVFSIVVEIIVIIIIFCLLKSNVYKTDEQNIYKTWDLSGYTQISTFFPKDNLFSIFSVDELRELYEQNEYKYIDTYSYSCDRKVSSDMTNNTFKTIYVDDNYFYFHPLKLLSGSYISEFDDNKDYVLIDDYAAWQLFKSADCVEGLQIMIDGEIFYVKGVYKHIDDPIYEEAGLEKGTIFLSYSSCIFEDEEVSGADCYEVILPNPVRGRARRILEENLGDYEKNVEIVDYSERYSITDLYDYILNIRKHLMKNNNIGYPYYENVAIYYLYVQSRLLLVATILFGCIVLELIFVCIWMNSVIKKNNNYNN